MDKMFRFLTWPINPNHWKRVSCTDFCDHSVSILVFYWRSNNYTEFKFSLYQMAASEQRKMDNFSAILSCYRHFHYIYFMIVVDYLAHHQVALMIPINFVKFIRAASYKCNGKYQQKNCAILSYQIPSIKIGKFV